MWTEEFESRGFTLLRGVLPSDEAASLAAELAKALVPRSRGGIRHLLSHPAVRRVANEPRLLGIARRVIGDHAVPFSATLFDKSPAANWLVAWHQDVVLPLRERRTAAGWGAWSTKSGVTYARAPQSALERVVAVRVHLDASTTNNGPLRVLPGSHSQGLLSHAAVERLAALVSPVECLARRGDVLVMRPLLVHASSKARLPRPRRVLHLEYASSTRFEQGLELAVA
jgi:ectoine hydroxylase-related dioxygenase (phytanoyl-CoA dioxygenase family)